MQTFLMCRIPVEVLQSWETSFNSLLLHDDGIQLFENFLKSEFSEENIQFWKACEQFKTVPDHMIEKEAAIIYEEYIDPQASKLVSECDMEYANAQRNLVKKKSQHQLWPKLLLIL